MVFGGGGGLCACHPTTNAGHQRPAPPPHTRYGAACLGLTFDTALRASRFGALRLAT